MRKKNRTGGITLPGLECTTDPQQSEECGSGTNADADQWNDRKPRNKLTLCDQLIHNKGGTYTTWRKDSLFNKWCWENWEATCKIIKLGHPLAPYTKINSNGLKT